MKLLLGLLLIEVSGLVSFIISLYNFSSNSMHKCLMVKNDYCDFNWWNSCLCLDVMFGYMNLKIIKLLMLNFTCLWCIYMYTCVLPINDEEWIVVDWCCCCCCYEVLLLMIHTLGVHNFGFVVWIELLLRVL